MTTEEEPEFQVALSFAGEQRTYVREVASELAKRGVTAFYDEDQEVELWGKDLVEEFQRIYMKASHIVIMFVSEEYASKAWTRHERRSALARALVERREYVLPVRFDDTALPGLGTSIHFLPLEGTRPEQLAEKICQKLVRLGGRIVPAKPAFRSGAFQDGPAATCPVMVHDELGSPILGAKVLLVAQNGTTISATTGADGVATVPVRVRRLVTVFVAHHDRRAAYLPDHDSGRGLEVTLPESDGRRSVIFEGSTGQIPGFRPRLSPIGDGHGTDGIPKRTYMYVENGSVDGKPGQPFHFTVGQTLLLEDSEGRQVRATCAGFVGGSTLWEYDYPEDAA